MRRTIQKRILTIWILSSALAFSIILNLKQYDEIKWLRRPYDNQVFLERVYEESVESVNALRYKMLMDILDFNYQKHFIDSIQQNIEKYEAEYKHQNQPKWWSDEADTFWYGGDEDTIEFNKAK